MGSPEFDRTRALSRLADEEFDLVVVGGGVTGCGVALDAAARGLRTALVEGRDFASGTSSKSSKMVHGGLRYLQQHDYLLVYEALQERQRLIHNAPHLVHPLPFIIPLFGKDGVVSKSLAKAYSVALWLYDLAGGIRIGKRHKRIARSEALRHFPVLRTDRLVAAFLYWDAQADDARLTLTLARTAASRGAVVANYSPVEAILEEDGRVRGVRLADGTKVRARAVVNAGGVWSAQIASRAEGPDGPTAKDDISIRPAKGIHIAVPAERLPCDYASVLTVPGDRRSIFVVPWAADEVSGPGQAGTYTYLGTTDTDYDGPLDDPQCTAEDIDYIVRTVNAWTSASLTAGDVTGTWAGLRPLISDARSARTADLSRRHKVITSQSGLVTVTGGKLTTYRKMAADTVDTVLKTLGDSPKRSRARSTTGRLVLLGGEGRGQAPRQAREQARQKGMSDAQLAHLQGRYGSETPEVLSLLEEGADLAEPLVAGLPYIRAEAVYSARREMACSLTDILARRTRALILDREAAAEAAPAVASLLSSELGWDPEEERRQLDAFLAEVEAERTSAAGPGPSAIQTGPVAR